MDDKTPPFLRKRLHHYLGLALLSLLFFFLGITATTAFTRKIVQDRCKGRLFHQQLLKHSTPEGYLLYGMGDQRVYLSTTDGILLKK